MTALKNFVVGIGIVLVLIFGVGFLLPSEFQVERSINIDAPADEIFVHVADLKAWKNWGVWFKRDSLMEITYSGPEKGVGMKSVWFSETQGSGEMQVLELSPNKKITYSLYFPEFDMGSTGQLTFEEREGKTLVTWVDYGDVGGNPIDHYFAAFMDSMIGPDFEAGLDNLKILVESQG